MCVCVCERERERERESVLSQVNPRSCDACSTLAMFSLVVKLAMFILVVKLVMFSLVVKLVCTWDATSVSNRCVLGGSLSRKPSRPKPSAKTRKLPSLFACVRVSGLGFLSFRIQFRA